MVEGGAMSAAPRASVFELILLPISILVCIWIVREKPVSNSSSYSVVDGMRRLLVAMP